MRKVMYACIGLMIFLLGWETIARLVAQTPWMPSTVQIGAALVEMGADSGFWLGIIYTVIDSFVGFIIGSLAGIIVGSIIGGTRLFRALGIVIIDFIRPIPAIVILPLAILLMGTTETTTWALVGFSCFMPFLVQSAHAVSSIDRDMLDALATYRLPRWSIFTRVLVPMFVPHLATATRICIPITLAVVTICGLVGGMRGLGSAIAFAQLANSPSDMFALIAALGAVSLTIQMVFDNVEKRAVFWVASNREDA